MTRGLAWTLAALAAMLVVAAAGVDRASGQRFEVGAADMPPPYATPSASNPPRRVSRPADATLILPAGFTANVYAEGLSHARWMAVAPNGDVFLAEPRAGEVTLLRDADGDGRADFKTTFAKGFSQPHGLAFHGGYLYVADTRRVWRLPYRPGQTTGGGRPEPVTAAGALGAGSGHWTRNIAISPDGRRLYVAIGSSGNIGEEPEPRATVQVFDLEGGGQETFAAGLRNPVGIAFYPGTDDLYVAVNERDGLGDDLVPDYLTRLEPGGFYGWPYAYIGPNPQPGYADRRPDLVARTIVPDVLFRAHSAPLGLVFYDADQFPAEYLGDAFVAFRGSWNSARPTGYKVVRVPFEDGRPVGYYEDFATGFWIAGAATAEVWGRPVGLAIAADGSLLVADDVGQTIWRISYRR